MLGAIVLVGFVFMTARKLFGPSAKKISDFLDDWNGEAHRAGVPERPGVMQRFQDVESWMAKYGVVIDKLDHEMHPNSGTSLADAVNRTERSLTEHIAACPAVPVPAQTTVTVNTGAGHE